MADSIEKLAFVFPGQGSQSVGMLGALAQRHEQVKKTIEEAGQALGLDLWRLISEGPENELNRTENTQPALLAAGVACWRLWRDRGGAQPAFLAGHSLGEYTALVAAGSLGFADAVRLVAERGRQMQAAAPEGEGAMAAIIGLDDDVVASICEKAAESEVVSPANFNAPGQVVIAGHAGAVKRASELAKAEGAKRALPLPVSVPSHCSLMKQATEGLRGPLSVVEVAAPGIPVLHNVDASEREQPDTIRTALLEQLYSPVRWTATVRELARRGVTHLVECGPGKVLCGLAKRIDGQLNAFPVGEPENFEAALEALAS